MKTLFGINLKQRVIHDNKIIDIAVPLTITSLLRFDVSKNKDKLSHFKSSMTQYANGTCSLVDTQFRN